MQRGDERGIAARGEGWGWIRGAAAARAAAATRAAATASAGLLLAASLAAAVGQPAALGQSGAFGPAVASARAAGLAGSPEDAPRPRLILTVAVDQLIPEQLARLRPWLEGGLGRFATQGLVFDDAALRHAGTDTAPGHACLGTGLDPTHHGIVGNDWTARDGAGTVYCVADPGVKAVTSAGAVSAGPYAMLRLSPRNLRAPGLADFLHEADPASIAISVSVKDRAAILQAGRHPDAALWWDRARGGFMSSTWYVPELPAWADGWNAGWIDRLRKDWGSGWSPLRPDDLEGSGTAPDDREGEVAWQGRRALPYPFPPIPNPLPETMRPLLSSLVYGSPAGDAFVLDLAAAAVGARKLGADDHTDLLQVSLSSCDTVGHSFGPYSREVTDVILRADRGLGRLLDLLDEKVGKGRWIAVLTADHGTLPLPEWLREHGIEATRLSMEDLEASIRKALAPLSEDRDDEIEILKSLTYTGIHLSDEALREAGEGAPALRRRVARALVAGSPWITKAWARDDLEATARRGEAARGDRLLHARSFDEERSPDVVFQLPPRVLLGMAEGTGHGSPYDYDRRIPLIFLGPGFPAGHRPGPAASIDAAPTLLHAAGLEVPEGLDGRVLTE